MRETLSVPFKYSTDPQNNTISGLATVSGSMIEAQYPTFLLPGFAKKTIAERMSSGKIKICWQHDETEPIGIPTELEENKQGLAFTAKISQTRRGIDAMILARDGVITETSIGFDALDDGLYNYSKAIELLAKLNIDREIASTIKGKIETFNREHPNQLYRFISQIKLYEISPVTWGADPEQHITEVHRMTKTQSTRKHSLKFGAMDYDGIFELVATVGARIQDICATEAAEVEPAPGTTELPQDDEADMMAVGQLRSLAFVIIDLCNMPCGEQTPMYGMWAKYSTVLEAFSKLSGHEKFEGKILSSKNKTLISDCIAALQGLLDAAEPPAKEGQALPEPTTEPTPSGPSDQSALLRETEINNDIADRAVAYLAKLHPPQEKSL